MGVSLTREREADAALGALMRPCAHPPRAVQGVGGEWRARSVTGSMQGA